MLGGGGHKNSINTSGVGGGGGVAIFGEGEISRWVAVLAHVAEVFVHCESDEPYEIYK